MGQARIGLMLVALGAAPALLAQEYKGPPPPKADVPYLLHAERLIETEATEAVEEERRNNIAYVVAGAASPVRTPLGEPIFILKSDQLDPQKLQLYAMTVARGNRETVFPTRRNRTPPQPKHLVFRELGEDLHWIEVNEFLENGEYCLTPEGANTVFCFQVY